MVEAAGDAAVIRVDLPGVGASTGSPCEPYQLAHVRRRNDRPNQPGRPTVRVRRCVFAALRPTPLCAGDDVACVCGSCGIELDRHSVPTYGQRTRDDERPLCRFAQVPRRDAAMLDISESDRERELS